MNTSDFNYYLPERLIAQTPLSDRSASRLLCVNRKNGEIAHRKFKDIEDILAPGDLLVINDSRVLPARLYGKKTSGSGIEFLLLNEHGPSLWETLVRPGKKAPIGSEFIFGEGLLRARIEGILEGGNRLARFFHEGSMYEVLDKIGNMPLPPYITERLSDNERYQTVYADEPGSAAAPTAGLHFTNELLKRLMDKGINVAKITLHVGLGTFRPVKAERVEEHIMHSEHYQVPGETAELINKTKASGGRVISVGTTVTRTLEAVARDEGKIVPKIGVTNIFITPGYEFKVIDGLITNFHLPESTLIMLVSAFLGRERTLAAYNEAVLNEYRFFSFGDAMFIL